MAASASSDHWLIPDDHVHDSVSLFEGPLSEEGWEVLVDAGSDYKVWRKPAEGGLYQYRSFGLFKDIPAHVLYAVNNDLDFRKQWDEYVLKLHVVEKQEHTECVYWAVKFPWPLWSRDYVYARRSAVVSRPSGDVYVCVAKACAHPTVPELPKEYVRVDKYHATTMFRQVDGGTEALLMYFDDMKGSIPITVQNWFAKTAIPKFRQTLIAACQKYMQTQSTKS